MHNFFCYSAKIKQMKQCIETVKAEGNKCPVCWKINKVKCARHSD